MPNEDRARRATVTDILLTRVLPLVERLDERTTIIQQEINGRGERLAALEQAQQEYEERMDRLEEAFADEKRQQFWRSAIAGAAAVVASVLAQLGLRVQSGHGG